jgi:type IV pilus assembly protein PilA
VAAKAAVGTANLTVTLTPSWNGASADWSCTGTPAKYMPSSCR